LGRGSGDFFKIIGRREEIFELNEPPVRGLFYLEKMGDGYADRSPENRVGFADPLNNEDFMILSVCAKLKDIYDQGRKFNWVKPDICPRCGSVRVWGHGFVPAYFDGFTECFFLRRFRCSDCQCVIRMKPEGFFNRFHVSMEVIYNSLKDRLASGKWNPFLGKSRQRHWLMALKKKAVAFFGFGMDPIAAFDRFMEMSVIPVSRGM
jgi:hypothetical protein